MGQPQQEPWQWPPELEVRQISERSARLLLDACRRAYVDLRQFRPHDNGTVCQLREAMDFVLADDGWYERHGLANEES